ncbi:hypothetical protein [Echinicola rosea]|uniref:DUF3137 domain-containing protein n=1 Tax=Echinicola rosea TaxID=1807691 RepID=A0ABQ1V934_9BACT|nr:hypothetical protein [Echinicola rosea]GGF42527.1 hypothetical protein GCM10011339_33750 [Echinicola rosea]
MSKQVFERIFADENQFSYDLENEIISFELKPDVSEDYGFEYSNGVYLLDKNSLPFTVFFSFEEFNLKLSGKTFQNDFYLLHEEQQKLVCSYEKETEKLAISTDQIKENDIVATKKYFESLNCFFDLNSIDIGIVDYIDKSKRELVLISPSYNKPFKIKYQDKGIVLKDVPVDITSFDFDRIREVFDEKNKNYKTFFKKSLLDTINKYEIRNFEDIFKRIPAILTEANLNFEVYLNELSISKIKEEYDEYKKKYFEEQSTILGRLTGQVLAIPISLAGVAFAIYRLEGNFSAILIVNLALVVFGGFLTSFLSIYFSDLIRVQKIVNKDFEALSQNDFFKNHGDEILHFEETKSWITNRSRQIQIRLKSFYISLWLFIGLIFGGSTFEVFNATQSIIFFLAVLLLLIFTVQPWVFKEEEPDLN